MGWALFKGEEKISRAFETKQEAYGEANATGVVKISQNEYWFKEGITLREVLGLPKKAPALYDLAFNPTNGKGFIAHFTAPNFPAINKAEIASHPEGKFQTVAYPDNMTWDEEKNHWNY